MKIIDTHAHYDDEQFDVDRDLLIKTMLDTDVKAIINIGCSIKRSEESVKLANSYDNMFAAVGIHPDDVYDLPENYIDILRALAQDKKVVAIGEIGLDYHYEGYDRDKQIKAFKEQLALADELELPVIIHSRDATEDTLTVLREVKPKKAVMHCFSGSAETAREILDMGLYISFTGVLTFKNAKKAVAACEAIPLDRLFLETDCPYMAPTPHRGERCISSMTKYTAAKLAEIKGITVDEAIAACNENAVRFFGLELA
ncbi:MAG: TatD family hydrolase [Eubacterium sp.]|nr:TatD family hydrolase [Eubacterium sp.]